MTMRIFFEESRRCAGHSVGGGPLGGVLPGDRAVGIRGGAGSRSRLRLRGRREGTARAPKIGQEGPDRRYRYRCTFLKSKPSFDLKKRSINFSSSDPPKNLPMESELGVEVSVSPELLPSPYQKLRSGEYEDKKDGKQQSSMCKITVVLTAFVTLKDIQIVIDAPKPFVVTNDHVWVDNLCEKTIKS